MRKLISNQRGWFILTLVIVGVLFFVCALLFAYVFVYPAIPWPSPQPYPGVKLVTSEGAPGSYGLARTHVYTVSFPLNDIQHYYEKQMRQYCKNKWQFEERKNYERQSQCRTAWCEIPRLWMSQSFHIDLYSLSEAETRVVHTDFWED